MPAIALNLVVIRSADPERLARFYSALGLRFERHRHGTGPWHLGCELEGGVVWEIYPKRSPEDDTSAVRLGLAVDSGSDAVGSLTREGAEIIAQLADSPWGKRAVLRDPDGHTLEVVERQAQGRSL